MDFSCWGLLAPAIAGLQGQLRRIGSSDTGVAMPLEIRSAGADEISGVARLYHVVWHSTQAPFQDRAVAALRDLDWFTRRLKAASSPPLIARLDGRLAGFAAWTGDLLGQLFVAESDQGQGIGRGLLLGAEIRMHEEGTKLAHLHCLVGNSRARRFYERNGWSLKSLESSPVESMEGPKKVAYWVMVKGL
jgi:GNAT superfamily N-acetyltransferase